LLFKDTFNFLGFETQGADEEESLIQQWHISEFLPEKIKKYFLLIVTDYMMKVHQKLNIISLVQEEVQLNFNENEELLQYLKDYVSKTLSYKLFHIISE